MDLKAPFSVQGVKHWFLVCIDDYSRYMLLGEQLSHCYSTAEITASLDGIGRRPIAILSDNGGQFKEQSDRWCRQSAIEPLFAHSYYPQDRGKVERAIRNVADEFVVHLRTLPERLKGRIEDYRNWFNNDTFHRGINGLPAERYECNVR